MTLHNFHEVKRKNRDSESVETRIKHFKEFVKEYSAKDLQQQSSRCMDCGVAFCHSSCPVDSRIPEWNRLSSEEDYRLALKTLIQTNPFPEFTGRVCPAPCESSCVVGINHDPVSISSIEHSLVEMGFKNKWIKAQPPKKRSGKKVAIVGSGPAGLSAAVNLNKKGHSVTVFEKQDRPGGLLMYGIPDFKLEKDIVTRRINLMREEGIDFRYNVEIGLNTSLEELNSSFDAVVLAIGAGRTRDLKIKGREAQGVHFAEELLKFSTKKNLNDEDYRSIDIKDKRVVVIGGGDTGSDCIGTSVRFGAKEITQLEIQEAPKDCGKFPKLDQRHSSTPWPLWPKMLRTSSSHEEGGKRYWSTKSLEFKKDHSNKLTAVVTENVLWSHNGSEFKVEADSHEEIPCDLVFLAIGFEGAKVDSLGELTLCSRGNLKTKENEAYKISDAGIFCCGDARKGQSLVVWAIKEGFEVASAVDHYLN